MVKKSLRQSVSGWAIALAGAPLLSAGAVAQSGAQGDNVLTPLYGDISPFYGDIDPFYGDIGPFYGDISPFYGDINPFYGDISPFWGDISPFWGDIDPFWGDIGPFYGDIDPFWGDIDAFWGDIGPFYGDISPFYGDIGPFWGDFGPFYGDIDAFWGDIGPFDQTNAGAYEQVLNNLKIMFAEAEAVFGQRVEEVSDGTFEEAFLTPLLARYGIDPSDPSSLDSLSAVQRSAFFLDFYDGLMNYTEIDRVDHWMATINWSPRLSQEAGFGEGVHIGLVDFSLPDDFNLDVVSRRGYESAVGLNHGYAVAGLIGARHDGRDIMGIAPGVTFSMYNPFDDTMTASWRDVLRGVRSLLRRNERADIINLSLGVSGWTFHPDWSRVFQRRGGDTLFVLAAGNDGVAQTANVDWTSVDLVENILIVGSVNPNGVISNFSNRPGEACLTVRGVCQDGYRLMDRFLVAPGELMLVWNGTEGVLPGAEGIGRQSGTSFAAPMVTGAAALVKSRWRWLRGADIANVLLWSAQDLGAPGVDPVYGWGLLDIEASLSPLDVNDLVQFNTSGQLVSATDLALLPGALNIKTDGSVVVFERLGRTWRDFEVPLDELVAVANDTIAAAQADAEADIAENVYSFSRGTRFNDSFEFSQPIAISGDTRIMAVMSPADPRDQRSSADLPFQAGVRVQNDVTGREMRFGVGEGALAMSGQQGFGLFSDHRPETGGVNPVLGFASGGAYAMTGLQLNETARLRFGVTTTRDERLFLNPFTGEERPLIDGLEAYNAAALSVTFEQGVGESLQLSANYTYLNEATGLLGAQGVGYLALEGGAETDALTVGAEARLPFALSLSSSATFARTRAMQFDGGVLGVDAPLASTAFQITARRDGVFGRRDALRLSLVQPLHVESGAINYTGARVIDRETGERAIGTESWSLEGDREVRAEMLYAAPLMGERADLSLFGRVELSETRPDTMDLGMTSGARFRLRF